MKKYIMLLIVAIMLCGQSSFFAQANMLVADTAYYSHLASSQNQADKDLLEVKMYGLLKSNHEDDWFTAQKYFKQLNKTNVLDSMTSVWVAKFPLGRFAEDAALKKAIDRTKNGEELEAAYKELVSKFPPRQVGNTGTTHDIACGFVIAAYAQENNPEKALFYMNRVKSKKLKCQALFITVNSFLKAGRKEEAKPLIMEAMDISYNYKTIWKDSVGARGPASLYPAFAGMYAEILYEEKKYEEALVYQQKAYDLTDSSRRIGMNELFASIYMALGKDKEAFEKLDESVRAGIATPEMKENLKILYKKVKGEAGFDEYMANVYKLMAEKIRKYLEKQIINQPAPAFTLTDVNGTPVSLESLKGKTVVVDFWATWCKPCIASFPAMQAAVDKYKNDPNVAFLFIHTWEQEDHKTATAKAAKFITDNKYSFRVLMDLKDPATGVNNVRTNFDVTGIPTKFVIDKNGNIRFKFAGFSGGVDVAVEEIVAMIDLAQ